MFHYRTNSQKPDADFYAAFKQKFPLARPGTQSIVTGPAQRSSSLSEPRTDANFLNRYDPYHSTIMLLARFHPPSRLPRSCILPS